MIPVGPAQSRYLSSGSETSSGPPPKKSLLLNFSSYKITLIKFFLLQNHFNLFLQHQEFVFFAFSPCTSCALLFLSPILEFSHSICLLWSIFSSNLRTLVFFNGEKVTLYLLSKSSIWWNNRCCSKKNWPWKKPQWT